MWGRFPGESEEQRSLKKREGALSNHKIILLNSLANVGHG